MKKFLLIFAFFLSYSAFAQELNQDRVTLKTPLTLEAIEGGLEIEFLNHATGPVTYKINDGEAQEICSWNNKEILLDKAGDKVTFYGDNDTYTKKNMLFNLESGISCSAPCYIYGNIMSLVDSMDYENAKTLTQPHVFDSLFLNNVNIRNKPGAELFLPATTLTPNCYNQMFMGCKGLTTAPILPAEYLEEECYSGMFYGCSNLSSVTCLTTAMFAQTKDGTMDNIETARCMANWLDGASPTGVFRKSQDNLFQYHHYSIPEDWNIVNYEE